MSVPLPIRKFNRKISLLFHYFEDIKNHTENLFCTGNINNLEETMDVKFENNTILEWPLCVSSEIMLTLPKLRITLKKLKKMLISVFHLIENSQCKQKQQITQKANLCLYLHQNFAKK